ncbi:MAG: mycothione reductase [Beutenbergiaceae bacterium]
MPHHDLVIIGTGSGNSLVTPDLEGLDIAIVESGPFGGTCLNAGCIPTKMLVMPADVVVGAAEAARIGIKFGQPDVDWPAIRDRVFGRIDPIAVAGEQYRNSQPFVTVYNQRARFVAPRQLELSEGTLISADQVVVAAGAHPRMLPQAGLGAADPARGLHTSDTIMRIDELPRRLLVLGGGYVGCEFAHVFAALGSEVTQVFRGEHLLRSQEKQIAEQYTRLVADRVALHPQTTVLDARRSDSCWQVRVSGPQGEQVLAADAILVAVGRVPNGAALDAETGGMQLDSDGYILVDDTQHTTAPGTWALGDVSSAWQLKHVANHEARVVAHNLAATLGRGERELVRSDHRFVPWGIFGHPKIAGFGPTAQQLDAAGVPYVSATQRYGDVAAGWAMEDQHGFLTIHASPQGQILAAHCLGEFASTLIQPLLQAASFGQRAHDVARGQYWIHPALSEVVENALLALPDPSAVVG